MKKLITVCAAVAMGFAAQAASVDWVYSVTGADASDSSLYTGYSAYLYDKATWDAVDFAAMAMDDILSSAKDNSDFASKTVGMGSNRTRTWGTHTASGAAGTTRGIAVNDKTAGGDAFTGYIVIFNADKSEYLTQEVAMTTRANGDGGSDASTSKPTITSANVAAADWKSTSGGSSGDVPEPTSGLLLLVGGAMLALRRKQK